jgi:hypothetical protein
MLTVVNTNDSGPGSLRGQILAASSGDQIVFDPSLKGQTIALMSGELLLTKNLDIEGPGATKLTITAHLASRVFDITSGVTATLAGLTIADGSSLGGGAGIDNFGTLTVSECAFTDNRAQGSAGGAILNNPGDSLTVFGSDFSNNRAYVGVPLGGRGGAIANEGMAVVRYTSFEDNQALLGNGYGGGAIANFGTMATLQVFHCSFVGNLALGSGGGNAFGGAIANSSNSGNPFTGGQGANLSVFDSLFQANMALGESSAPPFENGPAFGGGIFNDVQSTLLLDTDTFLGNRALAGGGNAAGGGLCTFGNATVNNCLFLANLAQGATGVVNSGVVLPAGTGEGGGIFIRAGHDVTVNVRFTQLTQNTAQGGDAMIGGVGAGGGVGGNAFGGGIANLGGDTVNIAFSGLGENQALAGAGIIMGGFGFGGGIFNSSGIIDLDQSFVTANHAVGGAGGIGKGGDGVGGGITNQQGGSFSDLFSEMGGNQALGGAGGIGGDAIGGGIDNQSSNTQLIGSHLFNSLARGGDGGGLTGNGGNGTGGAIANLGTGKLFLTLGCQLHDNTAQGGAGVNGGNGTGGAIANEGSTHIDSSDIRDNLAQGGDSNGASGNGGNGLGGGIFNDATGSLTTVGVGIIKNDAIGGNGSGGGSNGSAVGGGLDNLGTFMEFFTFLIGNDPPP